MRTFSLTVYNSTILSSTCFEQPSIHLQEDLYMQVYSNFSRIRIRSLVDDRMCLIKQHVFLKMNIWLFETCRRQYN